MVLLTEPMMAATKPHVLLVEDNFLVHTIHRKKLENLQCIVDSAMNGRDALAMSKNCYDLILLDCGLPDISGIEVCAEIRKHEQINQLSRVPIVMITAYSQTIEMHQECLDAGIDQVFIKPIVDENAWKTLLKEAIK